jgi:translation initiation factor 5B
MAPKKKGGKKAQDDWEAGLGETVDPIAEATKKAKEEDVEQDAGEEDGGGGLLAALRKNRAKKAKKGKVVEDFVEGEDPTAENGDAPAPIVDLAAKAPVEANLEDEDVFGQPAKKGKGGKAQPKEADEEEETGEGGRLLTKKEKEKAKKEAEKLRKKQNAQKKKTVGPLKAEEEAPKVAEVVKEEVKIEAPAAGGKKKKIPAHLAALQKQQEELRLAREAAEKHMAEAKARAEEEEKREAEEEKRREELKAAKKAKEKAKIEQQKKDGTFRTKAQREADARAKERLAQMLAAGNVQVGPVEAAAAPKKATFDKKKKGKKADDGKAAEEAAKKLEALKLEEEKKKKETEEAAAAAAAAAAATAAASDAKNVAESSEDEEWEAQAAAEEDDLKDSWDAPSEDEEKPKITKPVTSTAKNTAKTGTNGSAPPKTTQSSEEDSDDSDSESEVEKTATQRAAEARKAEAQRKRQLQHEEALKARSKDELRSPIACVLGHVDTGKTSLLDKIRQTNVQAGEAGGITQQIGATYFPSEAIRSKTAVVNKSGEFEVKVPGLLVIDTPGHESFSNLRSRGSSLCNIAILVVDIMHGLEPQTLESMKLLRDRRTPFLVALNKIDRMYGWTPIPNNGFVDSFNHQNRGCQSEFEDRLEKTKLAFAEEGFNAELFHKNKNMAKFVNLIPTSAHTGEGIPDLLKLLVDLSQTRMTNDLMYLSEVEATVLEVKVVEGLGTTIDVILSNGVLKEGDRIVLCGVQGPISTNIRALLTPPEMKEIRTKSQYVHNKQVKAAIGVKIAADNLEGAVAGSRLLVVGPNDDEEDLEEEVMSDLESLLSRVTKSRRGVSVQASTLGSLEALLEFLKQSKIPVGCVNIGPVFKRDVTQTVPMLER